MCRDTPRTRPGFQVPNQELAELALGRIFRILSRPYQAGDVEEYERCRAIFLDAVDREAPVDHSPNYARDRSRGAG